MFNNAVAAELKRFNRLMSEIDNVYHEAAQKLGLSDSAMLLLCVLCENGGECLLSELIRWSGLLKQTVNSALRGLEKDGVLALENIDGKKKTVRLTDHGKQRTEETVLRVMAAEQEVWGMLPEEERRIYLDLTEQYLTEFCKKIKEL